MFLLFHLESGQWKDITSTKHDIDRLKFYGEGDAALSQNDYDVTIADYSYRFTFKAGVNCKKIKFADDELWKDTDDPEYSTITAFDLGLISNSFFVKNKTKFKKIEFNPTQGKGGQSTTPVSEVITATTVPQTSLAILNEDVPAKAAVTVIAPIGKPRPSKTPEVATGNRTAITLDIGEKESNSAVDFKEDYLKNVTVFSAMEKYVFNKIVKTSRSKCCGSNCCDSETVIWEAKNQNDHFHTVYVDGLGTFSKTKNMSLHLCNGNFIHLNGSDSGPWSESPAVVDLDVRISNSNIQVDYFKKDNFRIYAAKPGYTIRKVVKSKKCSSECCCSPKVIWEADKEYALKVVLMGYKKEPKHLAILLKSGELTLLFKSGKDQPWEDITSSKNKITDLKMYAMADDKTMELHRGHYSITLFNEFYGYLFYEGVGCVKVAYKGKNIWDLKEEGDFGSLKGVFLDLKSNKFNVMNDDDRCWVCEQVRKVNPVTLDVSSKASTDDFDFTVDHNRNINVYTSKGNAMFYQVVMKSGTNCCGSTCCGSETVIWETSDPKNYATKVFADGVGACSSTKNVSIYLLNDHILHFGKGGRNKPWKPSPNRIPLDFSKTSSAIGYDYVHEGETRTFTPKPGYLFSRVFITGIEEVYWNPKDPTLFVNKVVIYGVESTIRNINIFLTNNKVEHFHKVGDEWVSETSIILDIKTNTDNDLFEYRSTRNFGHFNPKPNLTITKIVKKNVNIWTAKPEDRGLKAVLMGSGKDEKFLSILLQSGNFVLLRKCGQGKPWKNITQEKSDFSGIKMYSLDEGTSKYHELTGNDYDPIVFESRYGYEFKEGVKCVKITYNDKLLWSHTDDPEFGYLKGLYLDLPKDQFSVTNLKDQTKHLTKAKIAIVTLDIDKKESTNDFEHSKSHDFHKYTAKFCRVFSKVVQGTTDIWDSGDDVYGNSVGFTSKDDKNYVVVLLENGNFMLFRLDGGNWTDITSSRFDVKMLEFYDKNDSELTSSNYTVELLGHRSCFTISYSFDRGPKCKTVMYGYDIVYDKNSFSCYTTINRFDFNPVSNTFYAVKNCCDWRTIDYKPTPETAAVITKVSVAKPAESTKVTLDIEKTQSTNQFEYTDQNGVVTYTPKDDHVFIKVSQGTTDIWESKDDVNGTLVRTKTSKNVKYLVVLLTNNMFTLFHLDDNEWKDITSDRHDVTMLKFLDENDAEITSSDYTVSIVDLSFTYLFNTDVSCKKVKLGDDEVWNHADDSKFADIKSFSLGLASNSFFVKNQSDDVKKIEEKAPEEAAEAPEEEAPEEAETEETTPEPETPEVKESQVEAPEETTPTTPATPETTPEAEEPEAEPVTTPKAPETKPAVTTVALDIEKTQSTSQYDYTDKNGVVTYRVKPGHGFNNVTQGTIVIWESTDLYGRLVRTKLFSNNERFLAIMFYNNSFKLFRQSDGDKPWEDITNKRHDVTKLRFLSHNDRVLTNVDFTVSLVDFFYIYKFNDGVKCQKITYNNNMLWTHADDPEFAEIKSLQLDLPTNKFIVTNLKDQTKELTIPNITIDSLDINTSQTTTELDCSKSSDFHKYNPKPDHLFIKVAYDKTVIWESKDNLYGTEVMFIEGVKYLAVLLQNNNLVLFEQHNDKWHDTTSKRHDVTKVKFFGENNVELTKSDYNASFVDFFYRLKFNTNVKCVRITYNNNELWSHTDDPKFAEITLFSLGLASNSFFVKSMSGHCKKLPEPAVPIQQATEAEDPKAQQPADSAQAESAETDTSAQPAKPTKPAVPNSSEQSTPPHASSASSS